MGPFFCSGLQRSFLLFWVVSLLFFTIYASLDNEQNPDLVALFERAANAFDKFIIEPSDVSQSFDQNEDHNEQKFKKRKGDGFAYKKNENVKNAQNHSNLAHSAEENIQSKDQKTTKSSSISLTSFFEKEEHIPMIDEIQRSTTDSSINDDDDNNDQEYISDAEEEQGITPLHELPIIDDLISGKELEFEDNTGTSRSLKDQRKKKGDEAFEIKVRNGSGGNIMSLPENARMDLEDPLGDGELAYEDDGRSEVPTGKTTRVSSIYKDPIATLNHTYENLAQINNVLDQQLLATRRTKAKNNSLETDQGGKTIKPQKPTQTFGENSQTEKLKVKHSTSSNKIEKLRKTNQEKVNETVSRVNVLSKFQHYSNNLTNISTGLKPTMEPSKTNNISISRTTQNTLQQPATFVNKMVNMKFQNLNTTKNLNNFGYTIAKTVDKTYEKNTTSVFKSHVNDQYGSVSHVTKNAHQIINDHEIRKINGTRHMNRPLKNTESQNISKNSEEGILHSQKQWAKLPHNYIKNKILFVQVPPSKDTHCMDGSSPAYYKRLGYGTGQDQWIIHLHGGAWCYDLRSCSKRRNSILGSTKRSLEEDIEGFFHGILSNDPEVNPHFYNWNTVVLTYCDGGLFSGNRDKPLLGKGKKYYFQGRRVLRSQLQHVQKTTNLDKAKKVVLSGTSAGGLSLLIQANFIKRFLPEHAKVRGLVDAGFFLDQESIWNTSISSIQFKALYSLHRPTLSRTCVEDQAVGKKFKCLFPQETIKNVRIPLFLVNSLYDHWQLSYLEGISCVYDANKCDQLQHDRVLGFRNKMYTALNDATKHSNTTGVFANSCFGHGQVILDYTWSQAKINRKTLSDAFYEWFNDDSMRSQKRHFHADCKLPCNGSCNRLLAKRCVLNFKKASPQRQRRDAELC